MSSDTVLDDMYCSRPRTSGVVEKTLSSREQSDTLWSELQSLLSKEAMSVVPLEEKDKGFYSRYFLTNSYKEIRGNEANLGSVPNKSIADRFTC